MGIPADVLKGLDSVRGPLPACFTRGTAPSRTPVEQFFLLNTMGGPPPGCFSSQSRPNRLRPALQIQSYSFVLCPTQQDYPHLLHSSIYFDEDLLKHRQADNHYLSDRIKTKCTEHNTHTTS